MNTDWRKSSYSPNSGNCVECRGVSGAAEVRDSKHPDAATLALPAGQWLALVAGVRSQR